MRLGARRIETLGSVWFLDEDGSEYIRLPKTEGPRSPGPNGEDWGGVDAGELQDLVWHPMFGWEIRSGLAFDRLIIFVDQEHEFVVSAPMVPTL
jgi:hypothetical protein